MEIKLQKKFTKYLLPMGSVAAIVLALATVIFQVSTEPTYRSVLIANRDLAQGTSVKIDDFHEEKLPIGSFAATYLSKIGGDQILTQPVLKGELLSKRSVTYGASALIPIRLNGLRPIAKAISVGDLVDVWATAQNHSLSIAAPEPVVLGAIVTAIESNSSMTQSSTNVEIRITEDYLETLLGATDSNAQLTIILHETLADY
jgi:Flp pilus assembly protein CpaB